MRLGTYTVRCLIALERLGWSEDPGNEAYGRAAWVDLETTRASVVARQDLILLKRQADRPRDREDLQALEALEENRSDPEER